MTTPPTHGGKRPGSGRKATGPTMTKKTIALPESAWHAFDERRGKMTRTSYLLAIMGLTRRD